VPSLDNMDDASVEPWLSSWKVPRHQVPVEPNQTRVPNCTMHNFNTLPNTKRDVLVSSAYAAGTTVVDFTDPRNRRRSATTTRTAPTPGRRTGTTATSGPTTAGAALT